MQQVFSGVLLAPAALEMCSDPEQKNYLVLARGTRVKVQVDDSLPGMTGGREVMEANMVLRFLVETGV